MCIIGTNDSGDFLVQVTNVVKRQDVEDVLCTALEGGSNFWIGRITRRKSNARLDFSFPLSSDNVGGPDKDRQVEPTYHSAYVARGGTLLIWPDESEGRIDSCASGKEAPFKLDAEALVAGIVKAATHHGKGVAQWLENCPDADAADCALQFALFGELVFG